MVGTLMTFLILMIVFALVAGIGILVLKIFDDDDTDLFRGY